MAMKKILLAIIASVLPGAGLAQLDSDIYPHIYDLVATSPVAVAWMAILAVLALLSLVFWIMARTEEAKLRKKFMGRAEKSRKKK